MLLYRDYLLLLATSAALAILIFSTFNALLTDNTRDKYSVPLMAVLEQKVQKSGITREEPVRDDDVSVIKKRELFEVDQERLKKAQKDKGESSSLSFFNTHYCKEKSYIIELIALLR